MPRLIGESVVNTLDIRDGIGGGVVRFSYRTPQTRERVDYQARAFRVHKSGGKPNVALNLAETRQYYGAQILTDIREGDILYQDASGTAQPLTAKVEGWKDLLVRFAPELVEAVSAQVFEGAYAVEADGRANGEDKKEDPEAGE